MTPAPPRPLLPLLAALAVAAAILPAGATAADVDAEAAVRQAVTFYASFDEEVAADFALGARALSTRFNHPTEKGQFVFEKGFDPKAFRIAKGKGIHGGALEVVDVLPRNGRVFFPLAHNLAFKKG